VPNVVGQSVKSATKALEDAGFKVNVVYAKAHTGSTVYNQDPVANQTGLRGSTVTIYAV
jgi:beta-lactam-binding protein with PASTA domain